MRTLTRASIGIYIYTNENLFKAIITPVTMIKQNINTEQNFHIKEPSGCCLPAGNCLAPSSV